MMLTVFTIFNFFLGQLFDYFLVLVVIGIFVFYFVLSSDVIPLKNLSAFPEVEELDAIAN